MKRFQPQPPNLVGEPSENLVDSKPKSCSNGLKPVKAAQSLGLRGTRRGGLADSPKPAGHDNTVAKASKATLHSVAKLKQA